MSLEDDIKKAFGIKKPTGEREVEVREMDGNLPSSVKPTDTHSKPVGLNPPPNIVIPSNIGIDFNRIAKLSEFQRFIIAAIKISVPGFKGISARAPKPEMARQFNERVAYYREVMTELKEKLKERRERLK